MREITRLGAMRCDECGNGPADAGEPVVSVSGQDATVTRQAPRLVSRDDSAERAQHLLVRGECTGRLLGISEPAVHRDLEDPAAALAQTDLRRRKLLQDQVPRRTGARFIASHATVFDFDLHAVALLFG